MIHPLVEYVDSLASTYMQAYFTAMSSLHRTEISSLLVSLKNQVKKPSDDDAEASRIICIRFVAIA